MRRDSEESSSPREGVSRRSFGRTTTLLMAGGLLLPALAPGEKKEEAAQADPTAAPDEVESKLRHVIAQWGDRLSDAQRQRVRRILQYHVRMLQSVRAFPVQNGDSPASVLKLVGSRAAANGDRPQSRPAKERP